MKPVNQTKDWSTTIFGDTLPRYIFYGRIQNTVYKYDHFTHRLWVFDETRQIWTQTSPDKNGKILKAVNEYIQKNGVLGERIEVCKYTTDKKRNEFYQKKRRDADKIRREERARREVLRICGAPSENISRPITACGAAPHQYDGRRKISRVETENIWDDKKNPNPIPAEYKDPGYSQKFEMGQGTSGTAGKYTRSGWETKDGMKAELMSAIKSERAEKNKTTKKINGQPAGISWDKFHKNRYQTANLRRGELIKEYGCEHVADICENGECSKAREEVEYYIANYGQNPDVNWC